MKVSRTVTSLVEVEVHDESGRIIEEGDVVRFASHDLLVTGVRDLKGGKLELVTDYRGFTINPELVQKVEGR